ncbi:MAG TPA: glycosyltransferase family 4 protein [Alphaproteobacteria bacterium]|nr:glycosyltransferase family 4 protein [Alphaproteobacteria bacterium]
MRIVFYAPLKPPDHLVPSGDRRMAQLLIAACQAAGHEVELAARFRSYEGFGEGERQARLAALGGRLAHRLAERLAARPAAERPRVWFTYHLYYKAPDWLGPRVAARLGIPYVVAEASVAEKRAGGLWGLAHAATVAALKRAAAVVSLNPADEPGVSPYLGAPSRHYRLKPFLDPAPYTAARAGRDGFRADLARAHGLPTDQPWLVAVAMMRAGDKLASYRLLAEAARRIDDRRWRLLLVGDGAARDEVLAAFAPLSKRTTWLGALDGDALAQIYAASDLFVWPAINEAYGMAILEAQACGLPVVAGRSGGVGEIVAEGLTGALVPAGDGAAFAAALRELLDDPARRAEMSRSALAKVATEHDLTAAGARLDAILRSVTSTG